MSSEFPTSPLVVVVSFERLAVAALGVYGNQWVETPTIDQLAFEGSLFEHLISHDPDLRRPPAWWSRWLNLLARRCSPNDASRARHHMLVEAGSLFVRQLSGELEQTASLAHMERVEGEDGLEATPSGFPFPRLIAKALSWLEEHAGDVGDVAAGDIRAVMSGSSANEAQVLWLHSRGVPKPWEPPRELAELYFEDFEDQGWALDEIEESEWCELWPVYGSYVSLMDHALGGLVAALRRISQRRPVKLLLVGAAGELVESIHPGNERLLGLEAMSFRAPLLFWEAGPVVEGDQPLASQATLPLPAGARWRPLLTDSDVAATMEELAGEAIADGHSIFSYVRGEAEPRPYVAFDATLRQWKGVVAPDALYLSQTPPPGHAQRRRLDGQRAAGEPDSEGRVEDFDDSPVATSTARPLDTSTERLHLLPDDPWLLLNEAAQSQDLVFEMRQFLESVTAPA